MIILGLPGQLVRAKPRAAQAWLKIKRTFKQKRRPSAAAELDAAILLDRSFFDCLQLTLQSSQLSCRLSISFQCEQGRSEHHDSNASHHGITGTLVILLARHYCCPGRKPLALGE